MKYVLKKPVKAGNDDVRELTFREEIVAGDMRDIPIGEEGMTVGHLLKIAGRLCGYPELVINKLSLEDTGEVLKIVGGFMNAGPETGPTP